MQPTIPRGNNKISSVTDCNVFPFQLRVDTHYEHPADEVQNKARLSCENLSHPFCRIHYFMWHLQLPKMAATSFVKHQNFLLSALLHFLGVGVHLVGTCFTKLKFSRMESFSLFIPLRQLKPSSMQSVRKQDITALRSSLPLQCICFTPSACYTSSKRNKWQLSNNIAHNQSSKVNLH